MLKIILLVCSVVCLALAGFGVVLGKVRFEWLGVGFFFASFLV
jgi:hypothetical protein